MWSLLMALVSFKVFKGLFRQYKAMFKHATGSDLICPPGGVKSWRALREILWHVVKEIRWSDTACRLLTDNMHDILLIE